MELGLICEYAWDDWSYGLEEGLVIDGFVICFTVELCGEWEEVKVGVFVLVAFDVFEYWLELG